MKIHCMGAAGTVTGSCYIIETAQARFAVECGMHQGNAEIEARNFDTGAYEPADLDFILISHAHIDHSGLLPRLAGQGFAGRIYCTAPTLDLLGIMLKDSAHIQEVEAEWTNRKRARRGKPPLPALYTGADADKAIALLEPVGYNAPFSPAQGVRVCYRDAGHILGSAFLELLVEEDKEPVRLLFSGDLGRSDALIVNNPAIPKELYDYVFLESTYGNRDHKNEDRSRDELAEAIRYSYERGEKTIIPAFAVERTQEIIYALFLLRKEGRLPENIPVYVDSPLAIKATEIFRRHADYFDAEAKTLLAMGEDPLTLPNLIYTPETRDSQAINEQKGPGIIISASGMCNAGRVKHHLRHNLWRKGASVVFAGFQAVGTPGRTLVDGAENIRILGEDIHVAAKIFTIGGFSGHAGQTQILQWLGSFQHPDLKVFLVHGEATAQAVLADLIEQRFGVSVHIPAYREELELLPGKSPLMHHYAPAADGAVDWSRILSMAEQGLARLRMAAPEAAKLPRAEQEELLRQMQAISKRMESLASNM